MPLHGFTCVVVSNDFGYPAQRNYFETSHAKGEQDAAGAHFKQKASLAVVRRETTIQSAEQLCSFIYICHFSTVIDFSSEKYSGSTGHRNSWYQ